MPATSSVLTFGDVTSWTRDVTTGAVMLMGDVITADDDFRVLMLLLLLLWLWLAFTSVDITYEPDDVTIDDLIDDAVDPFMCNSDDAVTAELTLGDVTSWSRDDTAGVDVMIGVVMTADDP